MVRHCVHRMGDGQTCRAAPLTEGEYCVMHSPDHAQEMAEARRLGGLRRRREVTVAGAYDFTGLESVADIRRILEIGVIDALGLENSIARSRTLAYLATTAIRLLEVGELEQRLALLEVAVHGRKGMPESVFDSAPSENGFSIEVES